jgi:mRNA interferase MazF
VVEMELTLQEQLMTFKQQQILNRDNENKINNIITRDKVHSNNIESKDFTMNSNKINYNDLQWGDVLYVDLDKNGSNSVGSEQRGIRFAVCVQNDIGNRYSPTVIVLFVTSQVKNQLPTHVSIQAGDFGLPKDSIVLAEQVRTLDKSRIIKRVGKVDELIALKIEKAMQISTARKLEKKSTLERLPEKTQIEINKTLEYIYSYEKVLGRSKSSEVVNNLLKERSSLLNHLERLCISNELNYRDYYIPYTKERDVAIG